MALTKFHNKIFSDEGLGNSISHDTLPSQDQIPTQTGQSGKFLTTNGSNTSWENAVKSVSLSSGTNNGTVKLTVDGTATDNIAVKGLGSIAYKSSLATSDVPSLDASKITSGTFDISRIPAAAIEKVVVVATEAAKLELTVADVQLGDTVKVTGTKKMYMVKDESALGTEAAFEEYVTTADWSTVTNKPTTISSYGITDAKISGSTITLGTSSVTALTSHQTVTNNAPTLSWGATSTVGTIGGTALTVTMPTNPNTTYSAGTGLSLSGTTFNHSNSVTSGSTGNSTATSGSSLSVPYVTYDAQGHIKSAGNRTHTVSGFLTSHQDISGKVNVSGSRGTLAGYETNGTATTISATSADANQVSSAVTVSNGTSGTSWTKVVRFTAAVSVTKGSNWVWANGEAPTIASGGVMVCCWCGSGGIINYISPSS